MTGTVRRRDKLMSAPGPPEKSAAAGQRRSVSGEPDIAKIYQCTRSSYPISIDENASWFGRRLPTLYPIGTVFRTLRGLGPSPASRYIRDRLFPRD
jgi:hypothetical protein